LLVLLASFFHASWNYIAKRVDGGVAFVWLFSLGIVLLGVPIVAVSIVYSSAGITLNQTGFMLGSAILHVVYFVMLTKGYAAGDLSLVYPLSRGTGPILSITAAVIFLGERPSALAIVGALLIILGVGLLLWEPEKLCARRKSLAIAYGLLTGTAIAGYTLWDKYAVSTAAVPPIHLFWGAMVGQVIILAPFVARRRAELAVQLKTRFWRIVAVAMLCPVSYVLVLTALVFTPVSYVAPVREVSILIGTAMGARFLAEGNARVRLAGASFIVLGIAGLALG
jgi:drug/metabolite transporter (DMT)-like permease